jgi:hypothetical protein
MSPTQTTSPPAGEVLGHVLTAFLAALALVLPTYGALGVTSNAGLWAWFAGGIGAVAAVGALLRLLVPDALALVLLAASGYLVVAVAGIFVVATTADPPGNGTLALLVGVPAAAVGGLVAAALVRRAGSGALPLAGTTLLVVGLLGISVAPSAGEALEGARDDAAQIARLEASGLSPYLPEIGDLAVSFSSTSRQEDRVVGYGYRYEVDPDDHGLSSPYLSVDVSRELPAYRDCDLSERALYDCREGEGYYVLAQNGADQ